MKETSSISGSGERRRRGWVVGMGVGVTAVAAIAWSPADALPRACEATFTPATVAVAEEPVPVRVAMSEGIGEVGRVMAHEDSGIAPGAFNQNMGSLMLDVSEASPGEWPIWFHGADDATCEGAITVSEGTAD